MSRRRLPIRWRFTLSAAGLIVVTGAAMLGVMYGFMSYAPANAFPFVPITQSTTSPWPTTDTAIDSSELPMKGPAWDGDTSIRWGYGSTSGEHRDSFAWIMDDQGLGLAFYGPTDNSAWWVVTTSGPQLQPDGAGPGVELTWWQSTITTSHDVMASLLTVSAIVLAILAVLAGAIAWWWSGRALRPVKEVAQAVHEADASTLDKRINWQGPKDEIKALADDVDGMLDRLDRSFTVQRNFAANASHELITPLTTSQAMIDVALGDEEITSQERDLLTKLRGLGTRSLSTVDALMDLAEIDAVPLEQEPVDVAPLVTQSVANAKDLANEHNVSLDYTNSSADSVVNANDVLLTRAVDNLVDNAIVHNLSTDGQAWVTCADEDGNIVLTIENTGDVLTEEQVSSLGQPFYRVAGRVAGSTTDPATGHGLGLALARTIIEAHGGTLLIAARDGGGLRVTVTLPQMKPE